MNEQEETKEAEIEEAETKEGDIAHDPAGNGDEGMAAGKNSSQKKKSESPKGIGAFIAGLAVGAVTSFLFLCIVLSAAALVLYAKGMLIHYEPEQKAEELREIIHDYYLHADEVTQEQLDDGMYAGIMNSLEDPYSVYYTKDEYDELMESTSGTFCGVGLYLSQDVSTNEIVVARPIAGSPGEKAGILTDDILIKVDGEDIRNQDLSLVVSKVKGPENTDVVLTFLRNGKEMDFTVTRDEIDVDTVSCEMKDEKEGIGYIKISEFDSVTADQFDEAMEELKSKGMKSLIIDLRSNPGGNLDVVCSIADELLPEGLIVYTEDKDGNRQEYKSDEYQSFTGKICVLVDGNSASASEILTGALKDYGLGEIIGTTTFGKGIVQRVMSLGDGTAVKITVEDYFTPNGNNIHGKGIDPDIEVELDIDAYNADGTDNQLEKAIEEIKK